MPTIVNTHEQHEQAAASFTLVVDQTYAAGTTRPGELCHWGLAPKRTSAPMLSGLVQYRDGS